MKNNNIKKPFTSKLGWTLLLLACLCWLFLIAIPFLPNSFGVKAVIATTAIVLGEVLFWIGTVLVGKEVIQSYMNKWRRKK